MIRPVFTKPRMQASVGAMLAAALWLWLRSGIAAAVFGVASALAALAWLAPRAHAPVQRLFESIGRAVAVAVSWVLLAAVYFGVFVPLRLWRAMTGHDPLSRRAKAQGESYLRPLPAAKAGRFERMY